MAELEHDSRGHLKVFLGYAPGVGKSLRMLEEGRRRQERGQDVVLGAAQATHDVTVLALAERFEQIPLLEDGQLPSDAIRQRNPSLCLIDELAYRTPSGRWAVERWQEVESLLAQGVSIATTINLQSIVLKPGDPGCVPAAFLLAADDIEVIDAPTLDPQLSELRESALVFAAEIVDAQLVRYLRWHGIEESYCAQERVLVCLTPRSNATLMLEQGRREVDRFHGALFAISVEQPDLPERERSMLARNSDLARRIGAEIVVRQGEDVVSVILDFANREGITQIYVGHSQRSGFWERFRANPVERLLLESGPIDIRIFPSASVAESGP